MSLDQPVSNWHVDQWIQFIAKFVNCNNAFIVPYAEFKIWPSE